MLMEKSSLDDNVEIKTFMLGSRICTNNAQGCRKGGGMGAIAPPVFGRSVSPIPTSPPHYYLPQTTPA